MTANAPSKPPNGAHHGIVVRPFSVGINSDGNVRGVEILEYKDTYGGEIRRPEWRKQFQGKKLSDPIKLGNDIKNISGATLSSRSVTDGVKRLLAIRALLK